MATFGTAAFAIGSFASTRDVTVDFGSASDRGVIVRVLNEGSGAGSVTGVVIDPGGAAVALTAGTEYTGIGGLSAGKLRDFWLVDATVPTGSKTVRVTCADANGKPQVWALPISGVSAISSPVDASNGTSTPSVTISSATGRTVVAFVSAYAHSDSSTMTPEAPATLIGSRITSAQGGTNPGAMWQEPGASSVTINGSWSAPTPTWAMSAWSLTDGGASMTGTITLDAFTLAGVFGSAPSSSLLGTLTLDDFVLTGTLGLAPGRIDTQAFKNWSGTLLPGITIPKLTFLRLSDMAPALTLTNQTTAGDGVLTVQNAALIPGVDYIVVAANADGTALGAETYTAT